MAYFHCLIGGGSSGGGYQLTVTCDADFAGTTITCTDGVTTLTQTCPSASPYEVVFEIPNGGDWTISGVVGGHTVSTGVNIPTSASLIATVQQTLTIYSAKEDTISYVDIDGATQTITFASGETSKQVTIEIDSGGSSITFTSSVAKNPNDMTQYYSKTVIVDENTTEVYLMPDNTLYWWGYESSELEDMSTANGWTTSPSYNINWALANPTHNTNNITGYSGATQYISGVATKNKISNLSGKTVKSIITSSQQVCYIRLYTTSKDVVNGSAEQATVNPASVVDYLYSHTVSSSVTADAYIGIQISQGTNQVILYAFWYE